mmetsp:Transcript_30423/g.58512  ORF Transcript_30423/g.58512 Transcript_30423/m.58512 type:complete len:226 (-) Transcript_30423:1157-1834(-)
MTSSMSRPERRPPMITIFFPYTHAACSCRAMGCSPPVKGMVQVSLVLILASLAMEVRSIRCVDAASGSKTVHDRMFWLASRTRMASDCSCTISSRCASAACSFACRSSSRRLSSSSLSFCSLAARRARTSIISRSSRAISACSRMRSSSSIRFLRRSASSSSLLARSCCMRFTSFVRAASCSSMAAAVALSSSMASLVKKPSCKLSHASRYLDVFSLIFSSMFSV